MQRWQRLPGTLKMGSIVILLSFTLTIALITIQITTPAAPVIITEPLLVRVGATDPATGRLNVHLEFPIEVSVKRSDLNLTFYSVAKYPETLYSITVLSGGQLTNPPGQPPHQQHISLEHNSSLQVDYVIAPTYYPPGADITQAADAVSRLTSDLGVLRTDTVFPLPDVLIPAQITFDLPPGWTTVTPWKQEADSYIVPASEQTAIEYLAIGPFQIEDIALGGISTTRLATFPDTGTVAPPILHALLRYEIDLFGAPPPQASSLFTVINIPHSFQRGGSAGAHSLVVAGDSPELLAHEIFHWWNDTQTVMPEALWFAEGFTTYYGIKIAQNADAWTKTEADACLADLNAEMRLLEGEGVRSLADVSLNLANDPHARRLVYSKGALFALLIDRELQSSGRNLDQLMRTVLSIKRQGLNNQDFKKFFNELYEGTVNITFEAYVLGNNPLPDLNLEKSTGQSGCARYLSGDDL